MKENGSMGTQMDKGFMCLKVGINIKGILKIIKRMDMENQIL